MSKNKKTILIFLGLLIALVVSIFAQGYLLKSKIELNNAEEPQALVSEEQADVGKNAKFRQVL